MGQPSQACSPEDEGPQGAAEPRLPLCSPTVSAQCSSMRSRCRPRLLPVPIADRIAQHEHGIDVLALPTHADPFEPCFDDHLVGTFHAARANGPTGLLIGG